SLALQRDHHLRRIRSQARPVPAQRDFPEGSVPLCSASHLTPGSPPSQAVLCPFKGTGRPRRFLIHCRIHILSLALSQLALFRSDVTLIPLACASCCRMSILAPFSPS